MLRTSLGSSNVSYRSDGGQTVTQRYYPWGTVRPGPGNSLPTGYTFTGQLDSGAGLMVYGARFFNGALGRFVQPDTMSARGSSLLPAKSPHKVRNRLHPLDGQRALAGEAVEPGAVVAAVGEQPGTEG